MTLTLEQLAHHVDGHVIGDGKCLIDSVATLLNARSGQIGFLSNKSYIAQVRTTQASAVILNEEYARYCPVNALVVKNAYAAYAKIAQLLNPTPPIAATQHPTAVIDATAQVKSTTSIGPYAVIEAGVIIEDHVVVGPHCIVGRNSIIGAGSILVANVTICHTTHIGKRALLHPSVVIGADGFGQAYDSDHWIKVPQLGNVVIGDDVEIGAGTTIDRGSIEDTVIEDGVKMDNLIQIGHNARIGAHTVIAALAGVAGSTQIGKHCLIGGCAGIAGHLKVADGVTITGMSFIAKDIEHAGSYSSGLPAEESQHWHRLYVRFKQLDELTRRIKALEKKNDPN